MKSRVSIDKMPKGIYIFICKHVQSHLKHTFDPVLGVSYTNKTGGKIDG